RNEAAQCRVIEQQDAHRHAEQVEKVVVSGKEDKRLEYQQTPGRGGARAPRQKNEDDAPELDAERGGCAGDQKPGRQLRGIPRKRSGQGLRPEVIFERRQVVPRRVAREKLYRARQEKITEDQPAIKPDRDPGSARKEYGQKPRLQQQKIPLEAHEVLSAVNIRQVQREQSDQRGSRPPIEDKQQSQ